MKATLLTDMQSSKIDGNKNLKYSRIAVIVIGDFKHLLEHPTVLLTIDWKHRAGLNLTNR
jgi:hypothetical protein